jgi:hypothetical protein
MLSGICYIALSIITQGVHGCKEGWRHILTRGRSCETRNFFLKLCGLRSKRNRAFTITSNSGVLGVKISKWGFTFPTPGFWGGFEGRKESYLQDHPIGLKTENLGCQINPSLEWLHLCNTTLGAIIQCSSQTEIWSVSKPKCTNYAMLAMSLRHINCCTERCLRQNKWGICLRIWSTAEASENQMMLIPNYAFIAPLYKSVRKVEYPGAGHYLWVDHGNLEENE